MSNLRSVLAGLIGICLLGVAAVPAAAEDGTLVLHPAVWEAFQEYSDMQRPGAFAVSRDGSVYGYAYCPEVRCTFNTGKKVALESCAENGGEDCVVFAVERDIKVAYHVLDVTAVGACPSGPVPEVTIVADVPPVVYDFSYDVAGLTQFEKLGRARAGESRFETLGLSEPDFNLETNSQIVVTVSNENGAVCAGIEPGEIHIRMAPKIFVASDFRKGSCLYDEIMTHEERHHEVDRRLFTEYAADATRRLAQDLKARPFISVPEASMAQAAMRARVDQAMNDALVEFAKRREAEQGEIDTYTEYHRIANACVDAAPYIE